MANFCFEEKEQTLKKLKTSKEGLASAEAAARLETYGKNELDKGKSAGIVKLFFFPVQRFYDHTSDCGSCGFGTYCLFV